LQHRSFSPSRVAALAGNTFTGLVRLRAFYFLLPFALILIGSSLFFARLSFQAEFQILKDVSLGAMSIFSSLLAIVATAQLIPRDLEERTIYTILAKPVLRSEYLVGKMLGVLLLLALGILVMSALFLGLLFFREQILLGETTRSGLPPAQIAAAIASLKASAFNLNLLPGILLIYLRAALLASLTLFVSTFASSNIFTTVVMVFVYLIGHLQGTARTYWLQEHSSGWLAHTFLGLVALVFPDLQPFNLIDDVVAGTAIPLALFARTALLGCVYTTVYLFFAWAAFHEREL
jgi:ABC-type transport system involved in multi-copper enzyme maturation permease subunit